MKKIILLALLPVALFLSACDSLIDDVQPRQSIDAEVALNSVEGFEALLTSGYDRLQQFGRYGSQYLLFPDALADNINVTATNSNRYPGPVNNAAGSHLTTWTNQYQAINDVNNIIAQIGGLEAAVPNLANIKARMEGEARFLRALNYFDLMRVFAYEPGQEVDGWNAGVILRTEPTVSVLDADFRARATNTEVYAVIENDLLQAIELLGVSQPTTHFRARQVTAQALLARVYLYQGKWAQAEEMASNALANTARTLVQDTGNEQLLGAWLGVTHPEAIFELAMTQGRDGDATNVNWSPSAHTIGNPQQAFSFEAIPTVDLIAAHEEGDARLALYAEGQKIGTTGTIMYIRKYPGSVAPNVDNLPIIRLPELYLIRAEARAELGNTEGARADINAIRNSRNLGDLSEDETDLVAAVYQERRVEFAFEGHRLFDLKRRGLDIPKPQRGSVMAYEDFRVLAPLPNTEVRANPLLVQNPGY